MKKIKNILLLALVAFFISACEKKFNPAAPVHEPGRIVTCKIDGKEWSHGDFDCAQCHSLRMDYYSGEKRLDFDAKNFLEEPFHNGLSIFIYIDSVGTVKLVPELRIYSDYNRFGTCDNGFSLGYYLDTLYDNKFYIEEFNPKKKKIRGTFEFRAINYKCPDTVLITDGYFDLNPYWHK